MKKFGEKEAWAHPGTAQFLGVPPIISGTGKDTDFKLASTYTGSIGTKVH